MLTALVADCQCGRHFIDLTGDRWKNSNYAYNCVNCGETLAYTDGRGYIYTAGTPLKREHVT